MEDLVETSVEVGNIAAVRPIAASTSTRSRVWLAALAILLVVGYYVLSVVLIVVALVAAFYLLHFGMPGIVPAMFGIAAALAIFISILPRVDRFKPSGVRVTAETQSKLYEAISGVARKIGQPVPDAIYVISQLNAWVTERGGFMGFGRRRYMAIGLPLFALMTVSQLEGVLAHEFGHFYNGDMKLSPWIYRTRNSMLRAVKNITSTRFSFFAGLIYIPYVEIFLYITQAIVRHQEYRADELAAQAEGREAVIEGLHLSHIGDDAFKAYWDSAVRPLISQGVRPPVMDGFRRFAANQDIVESLARKVQLRLKDDTTGEYDSHPALSDRVAALKRLPVAPAPKDEANALGLIDDCDPLEVAFLNEKLDRSNADQLQLIGWSEVLEQVYIPMWRGMIGAYEEGLAGVTPDSLPEIIKNFSQFTTIMAGKTLRAQSFNSSGWHQRASTTIGAALALALSKAGWRLSMAPGEPLVASRDGAEMRPFEVLGRLMSGNLTAEAWREQCASAGIQGVKLAKLAAADPPARLG